MFYTLKGDVLVIKISPFAVYGIMFLQSEYYIFTIFFLFFREFIITFAVVMKSRQG